MNERYFYKENGIIKKYIRCSRCGNGPFKDIDEDKLYKKINKHTNICNKCIKLLKEEPVKNKCYSENYKRDHVVYKNSLDKKFHDKSMIQY
jgi:hypothetical protein